MKIALIVPYFGTFPPYFQLTLNSMKINQDYDWLIFTDDHTDYDYPPNVKVTYLAFSDLRARFQEKFEFPIALARPYKLCDFKPSYGYVFEEELQQYDFWGHCDIDCIYGCFSHFLFENTCWNYDKVFSLGHMTFFRNTPENNRRFMLPLRGEKIYQAIFQTETNCIFDEGNGKTICSIWAEYGFSLYDSQMCADIAQHPSHFMLIRWDGDQKCHWMEHRKHQLFWWADGLLKRSYLEHGVYTEEEFLYIHLMGRTREMKIAVDQRDCSRYKIIPHTFEPLPEVLDAEHYSKIKWWHPNFHYFRIRWGNLKIKLRKRIFSKVKH